MQRGLEYVAKQSEFKRGIYKMLGVKQLNEDRNGNGRPDVVRAAKVKQDDGSTDVKEYIDEINGKSEEKKISLDPSLLSGFYANLYFSLNGFLAGISSPSAF